MREVLGAGRGVQAGEVETPAMAAEAGRETRRGAESDEESDRCNEAQDSARVRVRNTCHIKPQGFTSRPPLLTTKKVYFYLRAAVTVTVTTKGHKIISLCTKSVILQQ